MARKPPARVRAALHRRLDEPVRTLPGLSSRGRDAVAHLERARFWSGAAHEALDAWTRFLDDPFHRLFDPSSGCGVLLCCPDPAELRRILYAVAHVLPPADARCLRRRLAELDDRW